MYFSTSGIISPPFIFSAQDNIDVHGFCFVHEDPISELLSAYPFIHAFKTV